VNNFTNDLPYLTFFPPSPSLFSLSFSRCSFLPLRFMHNMAGQYIRDAVRDLIQATFVEEILIAKNRLAEAQKVLFFCFFCLCLFLFFCFFVFCLFVFHQFFCCFIYLFSIFIYTDFVLFLFCRREKKWRKRKPLWTNSQNRNCILTFLLSPSPTNLL
jgi:hypothetical protein